MNFLTPNLYPAMAEIFMLAMACIILMADLLIYNKQPSKKPGLAYGLSLFTLFGCFAITFVMVNGQTILTFNNMYVHDIFGDLNKLLTYAAVAVALVYGRSYMAARKLEQVEFYVLVLFATLGMMVMISASHFVSLYLGLELLSLSSYALVAINRDSELSTEAAMKYFVLGSLASGLLLYGMSMIYGATGTLEIGGVAKMLHFHFANQTVLAFGLVFLVAGLAFKLGVVPFHMWIPDVYQGAPTAVTLFIGSAPKLAAFAITMRLLVMGLFDLAVQWQMMLTILAVLSIMLGNLAAIAQTNLKRMLAYSTISHMGFMLLGLVSGVVAGDTLHYAAVNAYSSTMFYAVTYVLMSLGTFGMILLLSRAGFEAERIEDFKGLNKRSPWFACVMMMLMFSMAGVPFFVGFFAKFAILQAVIAAGHFWLALTAVLFSLIGTFYYLRIVKLMYFDEPVDATPIVAPYSMRFLLSMNGIAIAVFGIMPEALMEYCIFAFVGAQ